MAAQDCGCFRQQCDEPIWPLAKSNGSTRPWLLQTTDSGDFHCLIGDCGSNKVGCGGESDLLQPTSTTIVAFTLNATDGMDYYVITLQNGFNLPKTMDPTDKSGRDECTTASVDRVSEDTMGNSDSNCVSDRLSD
ncbi:hypothetical protein FEM48_Zijuj10G0048600 [Ziziphus jujuba var. spinosa]|uniref:Uncharacterized protein n=1 Tax=Ziziphus jujuba var. spinosa TaxID=714518 RepID=A0A978ULE4_ZIZJJ|nr:hypothetical protein FEM48_Zijuj10G0048600 [Ziziphus jujuba var. spinosa]